MFTSNYNPAKIKNLLAVKKIDPDLSQLSPAEIKIVQLLIRCAQILDEVFYLQRHPDNLLFREKVNQTDSPQDALFYKINAGPFDQFDDNTPFIEGVESSDMAGFYPHDLTDQEFEEYIENHPDKKEELLSAYTIVVRDQGELKGVPYSDFYQPYLEKAALLLKEAAADAENSSLKKYLTKMADAFRTNAYMDADREWLLLDGSLLDPLLGAHEFYEDRFYGTKAAFTAFISIINETEIRKLAMIQKLYDKLQTILPIPVHYKNAKVGKSSPINIVDLIFAAGDARGPIQTAAFNLPNSHTIRAQYGSKKVLMHNIIEAKFESVMSGIANLLLTSSDAKKVTFQAYFNLILLHEISHELGVSFVKDAEGKTHEVSYYLNDLYPVIEEAKADVMGVYLLFYLTRECYITDCSFMEICVTYLASLIRSIRFGSENAHGLASIIQFNYLRSQGVFLPSKDGTQLMVDLHQFEDIVQKLLTIILTFQGEGDYEKTSGFIKEYSNYDVEILVYLKRIEQIPIDILPWFPAAMEKEPQF